MVQIVKLKLGSEFSSWVESSLTNRNSSPVSSENLTNDKYGIYSANFKPLFHRLLTGSIGLLIKKSIAWILYNTNLQDVLIFRRRKVSIPDFQSATIHVTS